MSGPPRQTRLHEDVQDAEGHFGEHLKCLGRPPLRKKRT
jgi:hypothetical protein